MLARRLGYRFFDLDEEVKREFHTTLEEFVHTENLRWRDQKRGRIIKKILSAENDMSGSLIERLEDLAFLLPGIGKKLPVIRVLSWKVICFRKLFLLVFGVLYHIGKVLPGVLHKIYPCCGSYDNLHTHFYMSDSF